MKHRKAAPTPNATRPAPGAGVRARGAVRGLLGIVFLFAVHAQTQAQAVEIGGLRVWHAPDHTRVVFDVGRSVTYKVFTLDNPNRLVVDIDDGRFDGNFPPLRPDNRYLSAIRTGQPSAGKLRFAFDLKQRVKASHFQLEPNSEYGYRLVVDLYPRTTAPPGTGAAPVDKTPPRPAADSRFVVAIDAGHGGEDPGAKGRRGTREKIITLQIAKELKAVIDRDPNMQATLVRSGDYFIKLRRRTEIARSRHADVFVSLHADAFKNSSVKGFGVFALSQRGASSETAKWLANKENAADLIGGVSLKDKDDLLAQVLLDLSMTKTISDSLLLGKSVLRELSGVGKLHQKRVEQARFAVLKSPDIPSILVETGFITNPEEENRLRSRAYRKKVAAAVYRGLRSYYRTTPEAAASTVATGGVTIHEVRPGDTLSEISSRYGVSMSAIKKENKMNSNVVRLGQRLRIPAR